MVVVELQNGVVGLVMVGHMPAYFGTTSQVMAYCIPMDVVLQGSVCEGYVCQKKTLWAVCFWHNIPQITITMNIWSWLLLHNMHSLYRQQGTIKTITLLQTDLLL